MGEFNLEDIREKYEFTIKELRKYNNTYDKNNKENLKFKEEEWIHYFQNRINYRHLSKMEHDDVGKEILRISRKNFLSHILEENYQPK